MDKFIQKNAIFLIGLVVVSITAYYMCKKDKDDKTLSNLQNMAPHFLSCDYIKKECDIWETTVPVEDKAIHRVLCTKQYNKCIHERNCNVNCVERLGTENTNKCRAQCLRHTETVYSKI